MKKYLYLSNNILAIMWGFILFISLPLYCAAFRKCVYIRSGRFNYSELLDCNSTNICNQDFTVTSLLTPPYSNHNLVVDIIKECCGSCHKDHNIAVSYIPVNGDIMNLMATIRNVSDFVFPFIAPADVRILYGWYFVPVAHVSSFIYITRREHNVLSNLIRSTMKLYPLVIICLSLAIISGFIIWLLETWFNEKEFPRPFFAGWAEGVWWSFISMTTVGYGDKTPKKVVARIFSVVWILMGISLFNILTAEVTSILVKANNPAPPNVRGKTVGVLKYREYDRSYVTHNGGFVYHSQLVVKNENFYTDLAHLVMCLRTKQINGLLLDKYTLAYTFDYFMEKVNSNDKDERQNANFMVNETIRTEKNYVGEKMVYGITIKNKEHYEFFGNAIMDNRIALMSSKESGGKISIRNKVENTKLLFDPQGDYFVHGVGAIFGAIACILAFGVIFEIRRRNLSIPLFPSSGSLPSIKEELGERNQISNF